MVYTTSLHAPPGEGKTAVVGATSGIGRAIVLGFAEERANVVETIKERMTNKRLASPEEMVGTAVSLANDAASVAGIVVNTSDRCGRRTLTVERTV